MTLRSRFVVLLAGFVTALAALSAVIAHVVFSEYARRIDEESLQETVSRALRYAERLSTQMAGLAWDWGVWDETYDFVVSRDAPGYTKANIVPDTFTALDVDIIAILDTAGNSIAAWQYDRATKTVVAPASSLFASFAANTALVTRIVKERRLAGFVATDAGLWVIGCAPVLPSSGNGVPLGVLIIGRRLGDQQNEELSAIVHPSARFMECVEQDEQMYVKAAAQANMLTRNAHLPTLPGFQGVDISLVVAQQALAQSFVNALYLPSWILISGAAMIVFMLILLERTVLTPLRTSISSIRSGMQRLIGSKDETVLLRESLRGDEIGGLASSIREILATLEDSRQRLSESETLYRTLIEFLPQGALCMGSDGTICEANRFFVKIAGKPRDQIMGRKLTEVWPVPHARWIEESLATQPPTSTLCMPEAEVIIRDEPRWYETTITRIHLETGERAVFLVLLADITQRIKADREAEARHAEEERMKRLAALGTLVTGVAHEVNNPNAVISLNMNVLRRKINQLSLPTHEERQELLGLVAEAADASHRIASLIASLKTVARPTRLACHDLVNVNAVVQKAVSWLRADIAQKEIQIIWQLANDLPPIRGNEKALGQVFVNLVQNACAAMENSHGTIRLKSWFEAAAGTVNVVVEDTGCGISPADMPHIFDPFFTTKRHEGGMGLGLSISAAILESHNGGIKVDSTPGQGTTVTVYLPVSHEESA